MTPSENPKKHRHHEVFSASRAGLPAGTRVANKWGFDQEVRANAGIVFTSNGDFVLVIFLRRTNWGDWQQASPTMADITVAAYNYFMLPR